MKLICLLHQSCRNLFFSWKRYWATHSLLFEICGIFFPWCEKKYRPEISDYKFWALEPWWTPIKMTKNDLISKIKKKIQIHNILSDFLPWKWLSKIYYAYFFFRESWERKKIKKPLYSLTHSFFEIFILKVTVPGKKQYDTFA